MKAAVKSSKAGLRYGLAAIILIWTGVIALFLALASQQEQRQVIDLARVEARSDVNKDLVYRRWATSHGGVYVPITKDTRPNPYLDVPNRDVTTTTGLHLTLINPAYMTRQVFEMGSEQYGLRGHITSLKPINPGNTPDEWEKTALESFDRGAKEASTIENFAGEQYLRLMLPFFVEPNCLKCHEKQGYKIGEVRGGISVSVPLNKYIAIYQEQIWQIARGYGSLWILGIAGILFSWQIIERRSRERQQATQLLRESEEKFRTLAENSQDYIVRYDAEGRRLYQNPAALAVSAVAETQFAGKPSLEPGADQTLNSLREKQIREVAATGIPSQSIVELDSLQKKVYLDWRLFPEKAGDGTVQTVLGISRDVTEQKNVEQQLRVALNEKEILLRELYHRTKNNMQVICSMLMLQAEETEDQRIGHILRDTESKIQAMALVHQKLYQSNSLSNIDLKDYLNDLAVGLLENYKTNSAQVEISLDIDHIVILIDTAIPCGLIVNELIINALKYAFPNGQEGKISIQIRQSQNGLISMRISDDGVGLPTGFDWEHSNTLGLKTVTGLVRHQLRGQISLEAGRGVTWNIEFQDNLYSPRI